MQTANEKFPHIKGLHHNVLLSLFPGFCHVTLTYLAKGLASLDLCLSDSEDHLSWSEEIRLSDSHGCCCDPIRQGFLQGIH